MQLFATDDFSRRHFRYIFVGALRVKPYINGRLRHPLSMSMKGTLICVAQGGFQDTPRLQDPITGPYVGLSAII